MTRAPTPSNSVPKIKTQAVQHGRLAPAAAYGTRPAAYFAVTRHRHRRHVHDPPRRGIRRQDMHWLGGSQQDRTNRHALAAGDLQQVKRDVGRIQAGHHQQVGAAGQAGARQVVTPHVFRQRRIALHFAFQFQFGRRFGDRSCAARIFLRGGASR
jgi:hypothetical protein